MNEFRVTKTLIDRPDTALRCPVTTDHREWFLASSTPVVFTETSGDYPVRYIEVIAVWYRMAAPGIAVPPGPRHPPETLPGLSETAVLRGWNRRADAEQWWCGNSVRVERAASGWVGWDSRDVGRDFSGEREALAYALGVVLTTEATP